MSYIGRTPTNAALTASDLADGIVSTAKIAADAVTDAKIADDVVGTEHLTANEVDTTALGADAVTGAQLADDAVNSEHYTDGSIDTAHIADGQVTTAKLATAVFTGATDIGAAIVDADLFLMDDGAGGTIRKTTAARLKTYAGFDPDAAVVFNESSADVDFRVESNGNTHMLFVDGGNNRVGIGTTPDLGVGLHIRTADSSATASSLADELVIENSADTGITILSGTGSASSIHFGDSGDNDIGKIVYDHGTGQVATNAMAFYTAGNEVARFDAAGKFRVLHGDFGATPSSGNKGFEFRANGSTGGTLDCAITGTSNHTIINFDNGNGGVGTIQMNGSATAYNTSSDYRLKENVNYDFDATSRLKQLKPARFNFKADADTTVDGFIAHEVSSVVPEAISGTKDAVREDGSIQPQGIDQSKLVPLLVKTIQELEARIKTLEDA